MSTFSLRTNEEFTLIYEKYVDSVYRVCFMLLKNTAEAQDAVQNVFIKLINRENNFDSESHLKAWLIVVAKNECKNILKSWFHSKREDNSVLESITYSEKEDSIINEILKLPDKYKLPLYLYYYEGYSGEEISKMLNIRHSTLRTHLKKGREKLKSVMEEKNDE